MRPVRIRRAGDIITILYSNGERYVFTETPAISSTRRGYIEGVYQQHRVRYIASLRREISLVQIINREAILLARKALDDMGLRNAALCRSRRVPRIGIAITRWRGFTFLLDISICAPISAPLDWRVYRRLLPVTYGSFAICIEPIVPPPTGHVYVSRLSTVKGLGRVSIIRFRDPALVVVKRLGLYFYSVGRAIYADVKGGLQMEVYEPGCVDPSIGQVKVYMGLLKRRELQ